MKAKGRGNRFLHPNQMTFAQRMLLLSCQQWMDRNPSKARIVAEIIKGKHKAKRRNLEHYIHPYARGFNPILRGYFNVYLEYLCKIRYGAIDLNRRGPRVPLFYRRSNSHVENVKSSGKSSGKRGSILDSCPSTGSSVDYEEEVLVTTIRQATSIIWIVDSPILEGFLKVLPTVRKNLNKCKNNSVEASQKTSQKNIPEPKRLNHGSLSSFVSFRQAAYALRRLSCCLSLKQVGMGVHS